MLAAVIVVAAAASVPACGVPTTAPGNGIGGERSAGEAPNEVEGAIPPTAAERRSDEATAKGEKARSQTAKLARRN